MPPPQSFETIPIIVSRNLEQIPTDPFYVYADLESNKVVTITQLEFGRATHRAAQFLRPNREGQDGRVVAILAESDTILYHAVLVGLMTANFVPFPMSPRNSAPAILRLLRDSSCHHIIATGVTLAPLLAQLQKHVKDVDCGFALNIQEVPSLQKIYPNLGAETCDSVFVPYPELAPTRPNSDGIYMYLHSSGSTGFPKCIPCTHWLLKHQITWTLAGNTDVHLHVQSPIAVMGLPPFHVYGIAFQLVQPLYHRMCAAVYPPTATTPGTLPMSLSPDNILEHMRKTKSRTVTTVPAFLVSWFNSPDAFAYLKTLHSIIWGGGPLPQRIGDAYVDAGIQLLTAYGSTETSPLAALCPYDEDKKDWAWFRIPEGVKVRWAPQGDGTFECQIIATETHVPMVLNLSDVKGYATSDLCVNHPEKKHLWRIVGRLDDTIVHTSGEKTVPAPMENIIMSSPLVNAAVVFRHERAQTGILIETTPEFQNDIGDPVQLAQLRNKVWPIIEEANVIAPGFSRIFKEMILFTSADKPLPRAGKGTVLRKAAISLYSPEIEALYNMVEEQLTAVETIEAPTIWKVELIQPWLLELAAIVCNFAVISPETDLRQQGFDSLTATVFRLHIMKGLRSRDLVDSAAAIPQQLVYARPTIAQLSAFLESLVSGKLTDTEIQTAPLPNPTISSTSDTVVELRSGGGIPLIMFPGAHGTLDTASALRANFSGTIWGIQILESTPMFPFSALAAFLAAKIREKRPKGPYRLAGYSGSSVVVVAITKLLEESGEQVVQLSFIDHFPLLWTMESTHALLRDEEKRKAWADATSEHVVELLQYDPLYGPDSIRLKELRAAIAAVAAGAPLVNEAELKYIAIRQPERTLASLLGFLTSFLPSDGVPNSASEYANSFNHWLSSVRAPLSTITAEFGMVAAMPDAVRKEWGDLGASRCQKPVKHCFLTGVGHAGIMADKRMAAFLQRDDLLS